MKNWQLVLPKLKGDWENKIKPYSEKHGAKTFGAVGTCWGSYVVLRLAEFVEFQAGVSFHPSHSKIAEMLQENEEEILKVRKPRKQFVFIWFFEPIIFLPNFGISLLNSNK